MFFFKLRGIDFHKEWVQAGPSRTQVPIPNPFDGVLLDKLSTNVKLNNRAVATQGSIAKLNPPHIPLPPGDSYVSKPESQGEVTNGCIQSVKVNNKPVAVLGSKVQSCDDLGTPDNSTIFAAGSSVKPPIQIPVTNPIDREITQAKWGRAQAKVGEEIILQAELRNQFNNLHVDFRIFPEGADVENDKPVATVYARHRDGRASAKWKPSRVVCEDCQPESGDLKFVFTADSFGCPRVNGEPITMKDDVWLHVLMKNETGSYAVQNAVTLKTGDGQEQQFNADSSSGLIEALNISSGKIKVTLDLENGFEYGDQAVTIDDIEERTIIDIENYDDEEGLSLRSGEKYVIRFYEEYDVIS